LGNGDIPDQDDQDKSPSGWRIIANLAKSYAKAQEAKNNQRRSNDRAANWTAGATVAIAFFTAATIGVGIAQWWILSGTLNEAKNATVQANRAWIGPIVSALENPVPKKVGDKTAYVIAYLDSGKSAAFNMMEFHDHFWINMKGFSGPIIPSNRFQANDSCAKVTKENSAGVIWPMIPGTTNPMTIGPLEKDTFRADADFINRNNLLGIHGCFFYQTFGKNHRSAYCFFLRPVFMADGSVTPMDKWSWAICPGEKQNYAD